MNSVIGIFPRMISVVLVLVLLGLAGCAEDRPPMPDVAVVRAQLERTIDSLQTEMDAHPGDMQLCVSFGEACLAKSRQERRISTSDYWGEIVHSELIEPPLRRAQQVLERAVRLDSTSVGVHLTLGMVYADLSLLKESWTWLSDLRPTRKKAVEEYLAVTRLDSLNVEALLGRSRLAMSESWVQTDVAEPESLARLAVQLAPTDARTHFQLGEVLTRKNRIDRFDRREADRIHEDAIRAYRKAIDLGLSDAEAYYTMSGFFSNIDLVASGEWNRFQRKFESTPGFIMGFYTIGAVIFGMDSEEKSYRLVSKALELSPIYPTALAVRSELNRRLGRDDEAVQDFLAATRLNPRTARRYRWWRQADFLRTVIRTDSASYAARLSIAEQQLDRHPKDAFAEIQEALRIKPDDAFAWFLLGQVYEGLNKKSEADSAYTTILHMPPDRSVNFWTLRRFFASEGKYDKAIAVTDFELSKGLTDSILAYYQLAGLFKEYGATALAIRYYSRMYSFVTVRQFLPHVSAEFADLYLSLKKYDAAMTILMQALQRTAEEDEERAMILFKIGQVYAGQGDSRRAIALYEQVIAKRDNFGEWHLALGLELLKTRRRERGMEEIRKAAELRWEPAQDTLRYFEKRGTL